jgi:drug/metabolite transporter (DMT)-like permease
MSSVQTRSGGVKNRRLVYLLAAVSVVSNAAGNAMLRAGMQTVGTIVSFDPADYLKAFVNGWVLLGVAVLFGWFISQLMLLSWADLSFVLPVTSVSYVLIAVIGAVFLDEHVSPAHWAGIALIICGVGAVARTMPLTGSAGEPR